MLLCLLPNHFKVRAGVVEADFLQIHLPGLCQSGNHPEQRLCRGSIGIHNTGIGNPQDAVLRRQILLDMLPVIAIVQDNDLFPGARCNLLRHTLRNRSADVAGADQAALERLPERIIQKNRIILLGNGVPDIQNPFAAEFFSRVFSGVNIFQTGEGGEHHIKVLPCQRVNAGLLPGKPFSCPSQLGQHHGALHAQLSILDCPAHRIWQSVQPAFFRRELGLHLLSPFKPLRRGILPQPGDHPDAQLFAGHTAVRDAVQLTGAQHRHLMTHFRQIFGK